MPITTQNLTEEEITALKEKLNFKMCFWAFLVIVTCFLQIYDVSRTHTDKNFFELFFIFLWFTLPLWLAYEAWHQRQVLKQNPEKTILVGEFLGKSNIANTNMYISTDSQDEEGRAYSYQIVKPTFKNSNVKNLSQLKKHDKIRAELFLDTYLLRCDKINSEETPHG